ncbi:hypothetical protein MERGE_001890 [Pneumocystis wakefieldiae]|uniref:Uncharacterized protein n=1 Tax=Pneumocystis wakefieldiae TaxID=38082 RepID=A0A899FZ85_9ASCO|nr:hypothetical protein MERGE_001890 [Pneumocystis wakefieldiae]
MKSQDLSESHHTCMDASSDAEKDHETLYSLHDLLDSLTNTMLSNIKDVYNTRIALEEKLDCIVETELKICLDLANTPALEAIHSECIELKERISSIYETFGEIESRIGRCFSILNHYQS